jgi:DNA repair protein RecO (recombination protein O)
MTTLARLLPERDPHPNLYEIAQFVLGFIDDPTVWPALYVRWELALLDELGVGLDLARCAATGSTADLAYVSPKSGRAVSADAGAPYKERLLALPAFLKGDARGGVSTAQVLEGLTLTGHFLAIRALHPRESTLPEPRERLADLISRL